MSKCVSAPELLAGVIFAFVIMDALLFSFSLSAGLIFFLVILFLFPLWEKGQVWKTQQYYMRSFTESHVRKKHEK